MSDGPLRLLLAHGSAPLLYGALVLGGLGLPLPEDVVHLSAGVLAHRGVIALPVAYAVCIAGVLSGDTALFLLSRKLGPALYTNRYTCRLFPAERRARVEQLYARHGSRMVFFGRFMSVLRVPVFAMAAVEGMPLGHFLLWDALALCINCPALVTLGYLGSSSIDRLARGVGNVEHFVALVAVLLVLGLLVVRWHRARRASASSATSRADLSPSRPRAGCPPRPPATRRARRRGC
ncbi:DedA family protein [Myxococcaceae bacterium JPH2]|nr:DedA family protein [Myxococcaceae bacterium JPH2]